MYKAQQNINLNTIVFKLHLNTHYRAYTINVLTIPRYTKSKPTITRILGCFPVEYSTRENSQLLHKPSFLH